MKLRLTLRFATPLALAVACSKILGMEHGELATDAAASKGGGAGADASLGGGAGTGGEAGLGQGLHAQHGQATVSDAGAAVTLGTPVASEHSFLIFGQRTQGSTGSEVHVIGELADDSVAFTHNSSTAVPVDIEWHVLEHPGMRVRRGKSPIGSNPTDVSFDFADRGEAALDLSRAFPIISFLAPGGNYNHNDYYSAELIDATTLRFECGNLDDNGGKDEVAWQVVELPVGTRVISATTNLGSQDIEGGASLDASLDPNRSFLLFSQRTAGDASSNGWPSKMGVLGSIQGGNQVVFERTSGGGIFLHLVWYAIELPDPARVQSQRFELSGTSQLFTLPEPSDPARTIPLLANHGFIGKSDYDGAVAPGETQFTLQLQDDTHVNIERAEAQGNATVVPQVVRF